MYRKFTIKDEEGKKVVFEVYPNLAEPNTNRIVVQKWEIDMTLTVTDALWAMITLLNKFMGGNTINSVEVTEVEEP